MAASKKAIENSSRLRYVRALQRFHKSIISYLSNTKELTRDGYRKKVQNSRKILDRVEEVTLYKGDFQDLQNLVKSIIDFTDSLKDIQEIKSDILYASNQLEKSKNAKRYKRDKHVKSKYSEWD